VNAVLRKRAEETLRRHQAELAHALRLGTMGELATGLAHELNQPLAAISNYARGCERRLEADGELADVEAILSAVRQVSEQALRAGQVIHRLRAHVRKSESRRDWCDVNRLVVEAMELVEGDARQLGVELRVELASEPARVQVDAIQVEQVLHNLVRNALDSVEESGDGPRRVDILVCRVSEDTVEIRVVDTGKGLAPDRLESVFDAFETTKREGLGLGLSIARSIVDTHGGKIWADANPDRGATFTFTLPVPLRVSVSESREIEKGKVSCDA
jgi:C4-dicarboxylate-specific signal transduction histidine kinase